MAYKSEARFRFAAEAPPDRCIRRASVAGLLTMAPVVVQAAKRSQIGEIVGAAFAPWHDVIGDYGLLLAALAILDRGTLAPIS